MLTKVSVAGHLSPDMAPLSGAAAPLNAEAFFTTFVKTELSTSVVVQDVDDDVLPLSLSRAAIGCETSMESEEVLTNLAQEIADSLRHWITIHGTQAVYNISTTTEQLPNAKRYCVSVWM